MDIQEKENNISIMKKELDISEKYLEAAFLGKEYLVELKYKQNNWVTSAAIGILGYFVVLLIQFKTSGEVPFFIFSISILIYLCVVILYGLIFKFCYEEINYTRNRIEAKKALAKSMQHLMKSDFNNKYNFELDIKEINKEIASLKEESNCYSFFNKPFIRKLHLKLFFLAILLLAVYYLIYFLS